jgi:E3 ubiquitin-protein ligase HECTD2
MPTDPFLSLHVRRNHLVEDSLNQLSRLRAVDLKKRLRIEFVNEDGVDAGSSSFGGGWMIKVD